MLFDLYICTHTKTRECLHNTFCPLDIDHWNSTMLKVKEFKQSFASNMIRTKQNGEFSDPVLGHHAKWV